VDAMRVYLERRAVESHVKRLFDHIEKKNLAERDTAL
jgi:hypothetical protein